MIDESQAPETWARLRDEAEARWRTTVVDVPADESALNLAKSAALAEGRELARQWTAEGTRLADDEKAQRAEFTKILRVTWGGALDQFARFITAVTCFGDDFAATQPADNKTRLTELLLTLHAAACSTAREVQWLLEGGYPTGAEARSRTLHETGVITLVLAQQRSDPDLLDRFMSHGAVDDLKYWTYVDKHRDTTGAPTLPAAELDELAARVDELVRTYGKTYKRDYGWAAHLCGTDGLAGLEDLVDRTDRRPFFKVASSAIHVNPSIIGRHHVQRAGGPERLSNATATGLARPAALAIHWLFDVCDALLDAGQRSDSYGLPIAYLGISHLRDQAVDAFAAVDDPR